MSSSLRSKTSSFTFHDPVCKSDVSLFYTVFSPSAVSSSSVPNSSAAPIFMIMGLTGVKEDWGELPKRLCSLLSRPVVVFDNRGIGQSTVTSAPYTIPLLASDAFQLLKHLFPGQRAIVFGCSMGGMIAQTLAVHHPEVVRAPLIVGCSSGGNDHYVERSGDGPLFKDLFQPSATTDKAALQRKLMEFQFSPSWLRSNSSEFENFLRASAQYRRSALGVANQFAAIIKFRLKTEQIQEIPKNIGKVLLLTGNEDEVMDWKNTRKLKQIMEINGKDKVTEVVWQGVGHMFWIQILDKVVDAVVKEVKDWEAAHVEFTSKL